MKILVFLELMKQLFIQSYFLPIQLTLILQYGTLLRYKILNYQY